MFTRERNLLQLLKTVKRLKESLPSNSDSKYRQRAEYLIIKANQLIIIDRRVLKNIRAIESLRKDQNYYRGSQFQLAFSELILDTETFFYVASKFIDLYFEGLQWQFGLKRNSKKQYHACERILIIRNNLIEHSHNKDRPLADEICSYGYNSKYGVYIRSFKGADQNKPYRERAYLPLRDRFVKEMISVIPNGEFDQAKV